MSANTGKYILRKTGQFILAMLVLVLVVFFVSRLAPGEPLKAYYGERVERMSTEQQEAARERLGLNDSLMTQFISWGKLAIHGDFGISFKYKQNVLAVIDNVYINTIILTVTCFALIFVFGLCIAVFCVDREGGFADRLICKIGVITSSAPEFFIALLLMFIFTVRLGLLPSSGAYSIGHADDLADRMVHLILPVLSVVVSHIWYCTYLMRNKLSDEVRKEYVLLCKVKGLSKARIYGHCLKNILPQVVSMMAIFLPHLIGGAYIVEMVFSFPGLGTLGFESAKYHDYNMLMVICLITGSTVILANMIAQVINEKLDPRMREEGKVDES